MHHRYGRALTFRVCLPVYRRCISEIPTLPSQFRFWDKGGATTMDFCAKNTLNRIMFMVSLDSADVPRRIKQKGVTGVMSHPD